MNKKGIIDCDPHPFRIFFVLLILFILFVIFVVGVKVGYNKGIEKINKGSWELTYNCYWSFVGTNYIAHYTFSNYSEYIKQLDFAVNTIKCKIIQDGN